MSQRFYSEPITRCARSRKTAVRVILGWALEQVCWLLVMLALAGVLWGLFLAWEWFTMAEGLGGRTGVSALPSGGLLPLAAVTLPVGGGVILLVVMGLAALVAAAVWKTRENDRGPVTLAELERRRNAERRAAMVASELARGRAAAEAEGAGRRAEGSEADRSVRAPVDPLETPVEAPGLNVGELERILGACLTEARAVRGYVDAVPGMICELDREDALRAASAGQSMLIGCLRGLCDRLRGAGDARPNTLKREQRTAEAPEIQTYGEGMGVP